MRKLSEIKGEEAMDITAELISIGRTVTKDKDLRKYLGKKPQNISREDWNIDFANKFYDCMLKQHRDECTELLAMISGVSVDEYLAELTTEKVYKDLSALMSDTTFINLFFASVPRRVIRSGSSSENTEGQKT